MRLPNDLAALLWLGRIEVPFGPRAVVGGMAFVTIILASCVVTHVVLEGLP